MENDGDDLSWVQRQAIERGVEVPDLHIPQLRDDLFFFWQAWIDLASERNQWGKIPTSAIYDYADRFGVPCDDLKCIIIGMDTVWQEVK